MQTVHYRAVVFDLDGTAVDSRYNIDALQLTCQEMLGRSATDEELKITYGMTAANAMRYLGVADDKSNCLSSAGSRTSWHCARMPPSTKASTR